MAICSLAVDAQAPRGGATVIKAGMLIDPQRGLVERNQTILVENGKVTRVGTNVTSPAGGLVIDLSKYTVLPGLMDAHTHLCMDVNLRRDAGSYFLTTLRDPDSYRAVQGVANAKAMLEAGFTTGPRRRQRRTIRLRERAACHRRRSRARADHADSGPHHRAIRRPIPSAT
jgi:imidazolonepropionase-like amidohydrolase